MAKLVWALLCQRMILDQGTNLVSYIDALDAIAVTHFPAKSPLIVVSSLWQRGTETKLEMRVRVFSPHGNVLAEIEAVPLDFAPQHQRGRMAVGLAGFDIDGPGRYEFGIETRENGAWKEVHRVPFDIESAHLVAVESPAPAHRVRAGKA